MAANRLGFPTPPGPGEDHGTCPVCGWSPCTDECRLGLSKWDLEDLDGFWDSQEDLLGDGPEFELELDPDFAAGLEAEFDDDEVEP